MEDYEIGDIVFVSDVDNPKVEGAKYHYFVIIDSDLSIVSADLFGFLVSSNKSKEKNNSKYKYNEPITKSKQNGLQVDSHVKCDTLYQFTKYQVVCKIGSVDVDDFLRFLKAYEEYQKETIIC